MLLHERAACDVPDRQQAVHRQGGELVLAAVEGRERHDQVRHVAARVTETRVVPSVWRLRTAEHGKGTCESFHSLIPHAVGPT